ALRPSIGNLSAGHRGRTVRRLEQQLEVVIATLVEREAVRACGSAPTELLWCSFRRRLLLVEIDALGSSVITDINRTFARLWNVRDEIERGGTDAINCSVNAGDSKGVDQLRDVQER